MLDRCPESGRDQERGRGDSRYADSDAAPSRPNWTGPIVIQAGGLWVMRVHRQPSLGRVQARGACSQTDMAAVWRARPA
jgi:hypothetical protein